MNRRTMSGALLALPLCRRQHSGQPSEQGSRSSSPAAASLMTNETDFLKGILVKAQNKASSFAETQWKEEYNLPGAAVFFCLLVWYWIAWSHRSINRKCAAMEAAVEKESLETIQMVEKIANQLKSDMSSAGADMKLTIAKNGELTGNIDQMTTALRSCQVRPKD